MVLENNDFYMQSSCNLCLNLCMFCIVLDNVFIWSKLYIVLWLRITLLSISYISMMSEIQVHAYKTKKIMHIVSATARPKIWVLVKSLWSFWTESVPSPNCLIPSIHVCWKLVILYGMTWILCISTFCQFKKLSQNFWRALYSRISISRTRISRILRNGKRLSESKMHFDCFL